MIAGRYQPLEPAKAGAPQRARDQQTAQTVLLREVMLPSDRVAEALRRLRGTKGIFHPALVTLFDVTELAPDRVLLAYEFVPAQSLRLVSGGQPFHPRRAAELMGEIADAVAELHARSIVHGAISADTVLVTLKGKAKLDRIADPSLDVPAALDEKTDIAAIVALLRDLTSAAKGTVPLLDRVLRYDRGPALGSAATLAASLRAAAARPTAGESR
jgi:serine/threonine protein kinase